MYRAISVAHRDRHLSVIFAPQIYNKLLVTTKTFCRKSAKYVVKHKKLIFIWSEICAKPPLVDKLRLNKNKYFH